MPDFRPNRPIVTLAMTQSRLRNCILRILLPSILVVPYLLPTMFQLPYCRFILRTDCDLQRDYN